MSTEHMRKLITLLEGNVHGAPAHLFESDEIDAEFINHVNSHPAIKSASVIDESDEIDAEFINHVNSHPAVGGKVLDEDDGDSKYYPSNIDLSRRSSNDHFKKAAFNHFPAANHTVVPGSGSPTLDQNGRPSITPSHYENDSNSGIQIHPHYDNHRHSVSVHGMHVGSHDNFDDAVNASNHLAAHVRSKPRV
jgi:hypothetical protein